MSGGFDWSQLEGVAKQAYTMYAEHQGGGQHPDQPAHHQAIQAAQQHIQSGTHEDPDVENVTQAHSEIYQGGGGDAAGEAAVRKFKAANGVDPHGEETGGGSDGGAGAKVVGGAILKKVLERQHASGQQSGSQGSLIAQVMNEASQLLAAHPEIKQQVLTQVTTMVMKAQVGHSSGGSAHAGGGAGGLVGQLMSQLNGGGGSQGSGKGGFDIGSVLKML